MTDKHLKELAGEIGVSLQSPAVNERDRAVLEQVHTELQAVLAEPAPAKPPLGLRDKLKQAIEQLEGEHPRLTSLLSTSLDALSDVGI
jgi:hypothetical protein